MKTLSSLASGLLIAGLLPAQTSIFNPDNAAGAGTCNVIPFGSTTTATWGNQKYQCVIDSAKIGTAPQMITDLGFAPCATGIRKFDTIKIQFGYSSTTTLSTTFAANLGSATTVLDAKNYRWHHTANTWSRIGLQSNFLYIPRNGHLVVDIEVTGAILETGGSAGMHRATEQRVYSVGWATPPATGSSGAAAAKIELVLTAADTNLFGLGCKGSNGTPMLGLTGTGQINSSFAVDLSMAPTSSAAILLLSGFSAPPLPVDLGFLGAAGCNLHVGLDFAFGMATTANGTAGVKFPIPNDQNLIRSKLWFQWIPVDKAANKLGLTTSNYGRVLIGL